MRWETAIDGFWLAKTRSVSKYTMRDYNLTFRRFGQWIKYGDIEQVTAKDVNAWLTHLRVKDKLAPKTVLNCWIALSSLWTWAHTELSVPHVIRDGVPRPKAKSKPMDAYTSDEVRHMLDACTRMNAWSPKDGRHTEGSRPSAFRDIAIIMLLVDTGLRVSELTALRYGDYDKKQGRLTIRHGKGDKPRTVFAGQAAQRCLWRYLAARGSVLPAAPLFATRTGHAMDSAGVRMMIVRTGQRAGVEGACPHRFRHTFAVNFLRNGGNIKALQDILGHSTLEMVMRYARIAEVDVAAQQKKASPADNWGF